MSKKSEKLVWKDGKKKRRVRKSRAAPRSLSRAADPFVKRVVALSKFIDGKQINVFFEVLRARGLDIGTVDEYLATFDWSTALQLLPYMMEFVETFKDLSGVQKEEKVLSLIIKLTTLAKQDKYIDENAILSLRIIISTVIDVSRGEFTFNEKTTKNMFALLVHTGKWAGKHVSCGCCCRK